MLIFIKEVNSNIHYLKFYKYPNDKFIKDIYTLFGDWEVLNIYK